MASHSPSEKDGKVVIGGGEAKSEILPAGATLTIKDSDWLELYQSGAQDQIESGMYSIVEDVKLGKEDKTKAKKAKIAAAKATLKALEADED